MYTEGDTAGTNHGPGIKVMAYLGLNWTTIVSGAINAVIIGFATATGIVFANRYTVRFLDKIERNGKEKK